MNIFKAHFENVDYPDKNSYTLYFHDRNDAQNQVEEWAREHDIPRIEWKGNREDTYFNHQFRNHPEQSNACYHGIVSTIEVL